ncbi:hypothetical protein THASP1DRAFT_30583 [Thamnocephalis sphaerospora]|uniref:Uncharacterized protein n=1 Tax=Thamnocephalis sphaerospora TaxID=78915 RepID=A0A4P9XP27_9FUNG|nr:hypothetical protein THASP1DRAFT_30583 [Thamnocephalis sphaerospora]|eukprot:RKP07602.1 hypothetical protein THASP1DRAFT_30583 [Thamnocephalis sphaerospora]
MGALLFRHCGNGNACNRDITEYAPQLPSANNSSHSVRYVPKPAMGNRWLVSELIIVVFMLYFAVRFAFIVLVLCRTLDDWPVALMVLQSASWLLVFAACTYYVGSILSIIRTSHERSSASAPQMFCSAHPRLYAGCALLSLSILLLSTLNADSQRNGDREMELMYHCILLAVYGLGSASFGCMVYYNGRRLQKLARQRASVLEQFPQRVSWYLQSTAAHGGDGGARPLSIALPSPPSPALTRSGNAAALSPIQRFDRTRLHLSRSRVGALNQALGLACLAFGLLLLAYAAALESTVFWPWMSIVIDITIYLLPNLAFLTAVIAFGASFYKEKVLNRRRRRNRQSFAERYGTSNNTKNYAFSNRSSAFLASMDGNLIDDENADVLSAAMATLQAEVHLEPLADSGAEFSPLL